MPHIYPQNAVLRLAENAKVIIICPKPTGMQVMAAAVIEEDTETIPDIYGDEGVFDDIDQQVMMVSTHEDATNATHGLASRIQRSWDSTTLETWKVTSTMRTR